MPTHTKTGRAPSYARGRFGRTPGSGRGRYARSTSSPRRSIPTPGLRRRKPEPSGLKKVMSAIVPTAAAKKATPSSKKGKAGGLALIAAAAGMAFKNRDKLRRSDSQDGAPAPATGNTSSPSAQPTV